MAAELPPSEAGHAGDVHHTGLRIATNTFVQGFGTIASAVVGLATFLILTRGLGPHAYGDYAAVTAFLFVPVVIADVGLTFGVLREITAHPERLERAMRSFIPMSALASLLTIVVVVLIGVAVPFSGRTKEGIAVGAVGAFLTLMTLTLTPVLQARLQMRWAVVGGMAGRLFSLAMLLVVFALGFGFLAAVLATVAGAAVSFLVQLVVVGRQISLRPIIDFNYWRALMRRSVLVGVANALGQINFRIDTIILALVRSPSEVGYYSAAYRFVELSHSISGAVGISVFPSLNRYAATGDDRRFARLAQRALDVLLAFAAPVALVMAVFGNEILDLTAGRDFEPGGRALVLLAAFVPFGLANHLVWRLLAVAHKDRALVGISGAALFAAILLNALLIPPYGMRAAALVTVAVEVAIVGAGLAVLAREGRPLPSFRYAVPIAVAAALALVPALLVPQAAVAAVAAVAVYCAVIVALPGTVRELVLHARGELGRRRAAQ